MERELATDFTDYTDSTERNIERELAADFTDYTDSTERNMERELATDFADYTDNKRTQSIYHEGCEEHEGKIRNAERGLAILYAIGRG